MADYKILTNTEFERFKYEWYQAIAKLKRSRYPLKTIRISCVREVEK